MSPQRHLLRENAPNLSASAQYASVTNGLYERTAPRLYPTTTHGDQPRGNSHPRPKAPIPSKSYAHADDDDRRMRNDANVILTIAATAAAANNTGHVNVKEDPTAKSNGGRRLANRESYVDDRPAETSPQGRRMTWFLDAFDVTDKSPGVRPSRPTHELSPQQSTIRHAGQSDRVPTIANKRATGADAWNTADRARTTFFMPADMRAVYQSN